MKVEKILDYIECPYCPSKKLSLKAKKELVCENCKSDFDVIEGVPILMRRDHLGVQEKDQKEWFEDHYSQFSSKKYELENWRLSILKRVFETDFNKRVKTYLDIGCGATGYTAIEAAKRNNWLSFGIDISLEAMLKAKNLARKQGVEEKTGFLVCSAENLPFRSNLFDYVSALSVLEHLENDKQVINGVSKIVKKGGHFYICVPNTYKRMWPFLWPIYLWTDRKLGHLRHYSEEGLAGIFRKEGFLKEKVVYNGHLIKFIQIFLNKLLGKNFSDSLWWKMEELDVKNSSKRGVQLNIFFKKA